MSAQRTVSSALVGFRGVEWRSGNGVGHPEHERSSSCLRGIVFTPSEAWASAVERIVPWPMVITRA